MTPEEQAAADAAAKAAADKAAADAAVKAKDPAYLEAELKKVIAERDVHKAKVKELTPAAARLKDIEDAAKSAEQKLTEENSTLKTKAARADALEAQVQAILDDATKDLTDAQKAVIVGETPEAKLAHFRALAAAGMLGEKAGTPGRSPGSELPGKAAGSTIKRAAFDALSPAAKMEFFKKGGKVTD